MGEEKLQKIVDKSSYTPSVRIAVMGVGGAGCNAVRNMIAHGVSNVEFVAVNTDVQSLNTCTGAMMLQIGEKITNGMGTGGDPEIGREAALEDETKIINCLEGVDMLFIAAGMGGGTGTGASPVIAKIAREMGILTVAFVTKPFSFEGKRRERIAREGISILSEYVDALIVIPNDKLMEVLGEDCSVFNAFKAADDVLRCGVEGIVNIIHSTGYINTDFHDIRSVMANRGMAVMGMGEGEGEKRAEEAVAKAIFNPLVETGEITKAKGIIFNVVADSTFSFKELNIITKFIKDICHEEAIVRYGTTCDDSLKGKVKIIVIATGFDHELQLSGEPVASSAVDKKELEAVMKESIPEGGKSFKKKDEQLESEDIVAEIPDMLKRFL